jgi:hypothetical protein
MAVVGDAASVEGRHADLAGFQDGAGEERVSEGRLARRTLKSQARPGNADANRPRHSRILATGVSSRQIGVFSSPAHPVALEPTRRFL